jgi:hypothetical protein
MNPEEARQLLEKYYNGESSLEEEERLKEFFCKDDIPEDLAPEKDIFKYFAQSSLIPEPSAGFENRIISTLEPADNKSIITGRRRLYGIISGIAAGLLVLTSLYFLFDNRNELEDTYSDPEIAYVEAMRILYDVSERLNDGTKALESLNILESETKKSIETLNKSASTIKEKLEPLNNVLVTIEKTNTKY